MITPRITDALDDAPPFFLFYAARHHKGASTHPTEHELVERARKAGYSLSARTIGRIGQSISWSKVKLETIDAFCAATGFAIVSVTKPHFGGQQKMIRNPFARYLKAVRSGAILNPFDHLSTVQKRRMNALLIRWVAARDARQ